VQEERSNSAQTLSSNPDTFINFIVLKGSHPGDSSLLEPRASLSHRQAVQRSTPACQEVEWYTQGGRGGYIPGG